MQWPGVWCSPGVDRDMARVEWSQQDLFFSIFLGGTFLGTLKLDYIYIYIPLRPIAYKMLTPIRLSDYNIS